MHTWSLNSASPLSLRIASDARVSIPDYADDQIWELSLEGGEPPSLAIQTTYGLRARIMRIFPGFRLGESVVFNPEQFHEKPVIEQVFPNYIRSSFKPFETLEVHAEYWVPDSHTLVGRFGLQDLSGSAQQVQVRLYSLLVPREGGERMREWQHMGVSTLTGRTENITPVIFTMGGATVEHTVYPALVLNCNIRPGETKFVLWSHVALRDRISAFDAARAAVVRPWDAEIARLELLNESMVDIETDDPQWDAAFYLSQKVAVGSLVGPTRAMPHPSFVLSRTPDRGYSRLGDGSDHSWQWDGQTAIHAYTLLPLIVDIVPDLAKGIISNFLSIQRADGSIDWKPGLGGQRNGALANPLLATLTWKIYEHTEDRRFLEETFPQLYEHIESWFTSEHDRDEDGIPEWDHTIQMGLDDCPTFVRWQSWGQGLDITKAETPDLASCLYRECQTLIRIARVLKKTDRIQNLQQRADRLKEAVESMWSEERSIYHYRDRDIHLSPGEELLGSGRGEFTVQIDRTFDDPVRLVIRSRGKEDFTHDVQVFIHGRGKRGRHRVEQLREQQFQWFSYLGTATSEKTYAEIERVEVRGLSKVFATDIMIADFTREDVSLFLPLWAAIPEPTRAERVIRGHLLDAGQFWRPFGIASSSAMDPAYDTASRQGSAGIWMFWNTLLGEALLTYGYKNEAAGLVQNLMQAVLYSLRSDHAFQEMYNADFHGGAGERDHIAGLAPLGLFLDVLGIRLITPEKIILRGDHPFPWPVIVRWKGLEIQCLEDRKKVTFIDGTQIEVQGEGQKLIEK